VLVLVAVVFFPLGGVAALAFRLRLILGTLPLPVLQDSLHSLTVVRAVRRDRRLGGRFTCCLARLVPSRFVAALLVRIGGRAVSAGLPRLAPLRLSLAASIARLPLASFFALFSITGRVQVLSRLAAGLGALLSALLCTLAPVLLTPALAPLLLTLLAAGLAALLLSLLCPLLASAALIALLVSGFL
jgi:hypothetical protein